MTCALTAEHGTSSAPANGRARSARRTMVRCGRGGRRRGGITHTPDGPHGDPVTTSAPRIIDAYGAGVNTPSTWRHRTVPGGAGHFTRRPVPQLANPTPRTGRAFERVTSAWPSWPPQYAAGRISVRGKSSPVNNNASPAAWVMGSPLRYP